MRLFLLVGLVAALATGCSTPLVKVATPKGERVGVVFGDFPNEFSHTHMGMTAFGNHAKNYPLDFDPHDLVHKTIFDALRARGYEPVLLELSAKERETALDLIDSNNNMRDSAVPFLEELAAREDISLLLTAGSFEGSVHLGGGRGFGVGRYGLFTNRFLGGSALRTYSFLFMNAFNTRPPNFHVYGWQRHHPFVEQREYSTDYEELSDADLRLTNQAVREQLLRFFDLVVDAATEAEKPTAPEGVYFH